MHLYPSAIFLLLRQEYPSSRTRECLLFFGCSGLRNGCYENTNHQEHRVCDDLCGPASLPLLQKTWNPCILFMKRHVSFLFFFNACTSSSWWKWFRVMNLLSFTAEHQHTQQELGPLIIFFRLDTGGVRCSCQPNPMKVNWWETSLFGGEMSVE